MVKIRSNRFELTSILHNYGAKMEAAKFFAARKKYDYSTRMWVIKDQHRIIILINILCFPEVNYETQHKKQAKLEFCL